MRGFGCTDFHMSPVSSTVAAKAIVRTSARDKELHRQAAEKGMSITYTHDHR